MYWTLRAIEAKVEAEAARLGRPLTGAEESAIWREAFDRLRATEQRIAKAREARHAGSGAREVRLFALLVGGVALGWLALSVYLE